VGMNLISNTIDSIKRWKTKRFLAKHGCTTQEQYDKLTDPGIFYRTSRINDFYHGYSYVYCCENSNHIVYEYGPGFSIGIEYIAEWAKQNVKHKWRYDAHRVRQQTGIGLDGSTEREWYFDEMGGGDYYFFAFTNEKDYLWFLLRWG
jgi:hypothetical protein